MNKHPFQIAKKFPFANRFLTGLIVALSLALTAFEWTSWTTEPTVGFKVERTDNPEEILPPITYQVDKLKKVQSKKPSDQMSIVEVFSKPDPAPIDEPEPVEPAVEPLAPIDPNYFGEAHFDEVVEDIIHENVQVFAHYKTCEGLMGEALKSCSVQDIQQRIFNNFKTTPQLKEIGGKQGALMSFVVDQEGKITEIKVVQSTNKAMAKAAKKAIENLPNVDFPANQQGRKVALRVEVPIVFNLKP